jgi:hypothetical protein
MKSEITGIPPLPKNQKQKQNRNLPPKKKQEKNQNKAKQIKKNNTEVNKNSVEGLTRRVSQFAINQQNSEKEL